MDNEKVTNRLENRKEENSGIFLSKIYFSNLGG